ncbi:aminopeptidase [Dickeya solani]|nr:aminopeptidase [Dickeya solani]ANE77272.1 hypothetical protein A4U42_19140 [Dickeya solani IPO 2222]AUH07318.1 hypothetical protein BJD21_01900 [Dickeya solani D s0432-1]AUH11362.1 hypothetical protein BJJ98_01860 [Dickeya solani]MZG49578.1 aminopeptidase [Dickeya solani]MZG62227.1 aminopeptidase [Dickeya solani]
MVIFSELSPPLLNSRAVSVAALPRGPPPDNSGERQREQFVRLVLDSRQRLETLYTSGQSEAQMAAGKAAEFERLRQHYRQMRDQQWSGEGRYDD